MFGEMSNEERDEMMEKFRNGEVRTFITTNLLARGIDVPEIDIVINYDVPVKFKKNGQSKGDAETYIHRIGRAGRFGVKGIAITLLDREEDKNYFDDILDHF
jgi:superfamily II DNA/RNA helicase